MAWGCQRFFCYNIKVFARRQQYRWQCKCQSDYNTSTVFFEKHTSLKLVPFTIQWFQITAPFLTAIAKPYLCILPPSFDHWCHRSSVYRHRHYVGSYFHPELVRTLPEGDMSCSQWSWLTCYNCHPSQWNLHKKQHTLYI